MTALIAFALGVLASVAINSLRSRGASSKTRRIIARDQAILRGLAPGSHAAALMEARIQATTTLYATGQRLPAARWATAFAGVLSAVLLVGVLVLLLQTPRQDGRNLILLPLLAGLFAADAARCAWVLLRQKPACAGAGRPGGSESASVAGSAASSTMSASASVDVDRPAHEVWAFIEDPASQVRLRDDVISGVRMPGTPRGVGEVQAFVLRGDGLRGAMIEVLEWGPGARALTRQLGDDLPPPMIGLHTETRVQPLTEGRCRLTHTHIALMAVPEGQLVAGAVAKWEKAMVAELDHMHARLKNLMEAGPSAAAPVAAP